MKKTFLTVFGIVGALLFIASSAHGRNSENQNDNILLNESSIYLESSDMKVGDYHCIYEFSRCGGGFDLTVGIYERDGACGNYYALVYGEKYKVLTGQWRHCQNDYNYSFVYNGKRYLFNL